jgi:hypothetical protein
VSKRAKYKNRVRGNDLHRLSIAILRSISQDPWEGLDSKRPLGSSDIEGDVAEAIGLIRLSDEEVDEDREAYDDEQAYLREIYEDWAEYALKTMRRTTSAP